MTLLLPPGRPSSFLSSNPYLYIGNRFLREAPRPTDSSCKQFHPVLQRATVCQVPGDTAVNEPGEAPIPAGVKSKVTQTDYCHNVCTPCPHADTGPVWQLRRGFWEEDPKPTLRGEAELVGGRHAVRSSHPWTCISPTAPQLHTQHRHTLRGVSPSLPPSPRQGHPCHLRAHPESACSLHHHSHCPV